jgi:hypothetical protein
MSALWDAAAPCSLRDLDSAASCSEIHCNIMMETAYCMRCLFCVYRITLVWILRCVSLRQRAAGGVTKIYTKEGKKIRMRKKPPAAGLTSVCEVA